MKILLQITRKTTSIQQQQNINFTRFVVGMKYIDSIYNTIIIVAYFHHFFLGTLL
jgi:hypothetical protein